MADPRDTCSQPPRRLSLQLCGAIAAGLVVAELVVFAHLVQSRRGALVVLEEERLETVVLSLGSRREPDVLRERLAELRERGIVALRPTDERGRELTRDDSVLTLRMDGLEVQASLERIDGEVAALRLRLALAGLLLLGAGCGAAWAFMRGNRTIGAAEHVDLYARRLEERNEELFSAKRRAEQADRTKTEFLANLSHELRTPLTAILGFADMLIERARKGGLPQADLEHARTIQRNGQYLYRLLEGLLDYSNLESGRLRLDWVPCSPTDIVRDVELVSGPAADEKGLRLRVEIEDEVPETFTSDPTRVRQILLALVDNAVKFSHEGSVTLRLSLLSDQYPQGQLALDVVDTGIGMTEDQLANLFEPFSPGDGSCAREYGGLGMGLALSRRLARRLQGDITVVSTPSEGSAFRLTLPLEPKLEDEAPSAESSPADEEACLEGHVLVAEDGADTRRLLQLLLEGAGAEVTLVENGAEAVTLALEAWRNDEAFEVILMDAQMPVTDGVQATGALRLQGYPGVIVALTADSQASNREACLRAGCDEFLAKPIDRQRLLALLRSLMKPTARI